MKKNADRLRRNDASRNRAQHHSEPWSPSELEQLTEYWDGTEETLEDIAEILGRTIEACRQRYYEVRRGEVHVTHIVEVRTTTEVRYIGAHDDPEDRWWETR